jgi:DNA (cytosine-5-)-methyltransferase
LEELDEDNISTIYRKVVTNSVAYMMMERLGIDTEEYFEREDFEDIINFNTPGTLNALGFATSDIAEMGLTEIAKTVMSLERQNRIIAENRKPDYNIGRNQNTERSPQNERTDIHDAGRLQTAQFGAAGAAGSADGTVSLVKKQPLIPVLGLKDLEKWHWRKVVIFQSQMEHRF